MLANAVNTAWNYVNGIGAWSDDRGSIGATRRYLRDLTKGSGRLLSLPSQVVQEVVDAYVIKRRAAPLFEVALAS